MAFDLIWRVTCDGEPMYLGIDEALAKRIYDHWKGTPGHKTVLERSELNWWKVADSPVTGGTT